MEQIRPGETRVLGGGAVVRAREARFLVPIDKTHELDPLNHHEAAHTAVQRALGLTVDHVTNIAEGNSLGHMAGPFNPITAAAPKALNLPGCGDESTPDSDIYQIVQNGYSVKDSVAAAGRICERNKRNIAAIATGLKHSRYLTGGAVDSIRGAVAQGARVDFEVETKGKKKTGTVAGVHETDLPIPIDLSRAL